MTKERSRVKITGMHCAACAQTIERALLKAEGVDKAVVNLTTETAYIEYDGNIVNEEKLLSWLNVTSKQLLSMRARGFPYIQIANGKRMYHLPTVCQWLKGREKGLNP